MNKNKQTPRLVWFTGLSGAGKTTLANALHKKLSEQGFSSYVLDGDNIRCGINRDLSFSPQDRSENIRRVIEIASLFLDAGIIVITAFISPYEKDRQKAKNKIGKANFIEVYLSTPLDVCESRDVKNLYKKARSGEITDFTGINAPYEVPISADIKIDTSNLSIEKSVDKILKCVFK
ncbi:adenylyl-sulfate kinase [uncultured Aquimarina sp.]|uniref:adenylyl-sulfate kinase n=1 Tax=uncultured Aquimarina sp. TaxID=575652 RepID=UPI002620F636|nr:adenylyl-sulfate kinase [uncultured Aquimarina sp.]